MTNNNKMSSWGSIINAVKTPLGFFTLVVLILEGVLLVTAKSIEKISILIPIGLLGLVVVLVFAIAWRKPHVLYGWQTATVNLTFLEADPHISETLRKLEVDPINVDLDLTRCSYKICDKKGNVKHSGTPNLTFDKGGWTFKVDEDIGPSDSIRLELVECSGQKWKVRPFLPSRTDQRAIQINRNVER